MNRKSRRKSKSKMFEIPVAFKVGNTIFTDNEIKDKFEEDLKKDKANSDIIVEGISNFQYYPSRNALRLNTQIALQYELFPDQVFYIIQSSENIPKKELN